MKYPTDNQWKQLNQGDIFGALHDTKNIVIDGTGKIRLSRKPFSIYTSVQDSNLAYVMAIVYYNNDYHAITSDNIFRFDLQRSSYNEITSGPNTTLSTDCEVFNGNMYVTFDNNWQHWNGTSWSSNLGSLTSGVPHPMTTFGALIAVGNGNKVGLYNTSHVLQSNELTLPTRYQVTTIRARNNFLYVGTKDLNGGEARVFIWNADSNNFDYEVPVGASWVFSLVEYGPTVACITNAGQLLLINGNVAQQLAALPCYYVPDVNWQDSNGLTLNGKVFNRGMTTVGNRIYINVDGSLDRGYVPEMRSGIWVYDPLVGLYHRSSHSADAIRSDASISIASNIITTSSAHGLVTGDSVCFETVTGLTGVDTGVQYYVKVESSTTFKLALSRRAIDEENFLTISGTVSSGAGLVYTPNTDYGAFLGTGSSGAITKVTALETTFPNLTSEVIWGARFENEAGTAVYSIQSMVNAFNVGSFTTQKIYSENIEQVWKSIFSFLDTKLSGNETVIVKYKTADDFRRISKELTGVWLDTDTINSSNADEDEWRDIQVGDELIIVDGYGRSYSTQVTDKTGTSTISITIDEAIGLANEPVTVYFTPFKKLGSYTKANISNAYTESSLKLDNKSPWIMVRIELRGFEIGVSHLHVTNAIHKAAV